MINSGLKYAISLEGIKRNNGDINHPPLLEESPYYIGTGNIPLYKKIKKEGVNCSGLVNLIRRYLGLEIPGMIIAEPEHYWPGGTGAWFSYLLCKNRLEIIDYDIVYPKGTLLLEDFNKENQGHLAIVVNSHSKGLLFSKIIHSRWEPEISRVIIETFNNYKFKGKINKRFTHVCLPDNWLIKN